VPHTIQSRALRTIQSSVITFMLAAQPIHAQQPIFNRNVIVLDPAHGGPDSGARITDSLTEKQLTLAIAARLKPLLTAAGFTVLTTRDTDPATVLSPDQRAGSANHARALACLLLHATPSGAGVHLFTSSLAATDASPDATLPWDSAQSAYIPLSLRLANELGVSLLHASIPPLLGHASIRPIDNLTCPAVALEFAPLNSQTPLSDATYQQHTAQAVADALISWRNHAAPAPATPIAAKPTPLANKPIPPPSKPATAQPESVKPITTLPTPPPPNAAPAGAPR
jgi:N-acetylmuramoyl-L-alanine amidase